MRFGDPQHYLTPDVDCDFTTVEVHEIAENRVLVANASGGPAPANYKVSLAYCNGFFASGMLLVRGSDARAKAEVAAKIVRERLRLANYEPERWEVEYLGDAQHARELMLRISVHDSRREVVERFTRELAPLITSGPAGLAGYAAGRPTVRPVYAYWPTLVPQRLVSSQVEVKSAQEWLS